jgi:hypothetical protein
MQPDDQQMLDAYLDNRLTPAERSAFEQRFEHEPKLRAAVESQQRIDAALKRIYRAPNAEAVLARARAQAALRPDGAPRIIKLAWAVGAVGAAAALVMFAVYTGVFDLRPSRPKVVDPDAYKRLETIYDAQVAAGFKPNWECREPEQFKSTFRNDLGQGLAFAMIPSNASVWGIGYAETLMSVNTRLILVKLDETPILVFVDRLSADRELSLPPGRGLNLFRREAGGLVLYEVSPLPEAKVLPLLSAVE